MSIRIGIIGPGRISDDQLAPAVEVTDGAVLWSVLSRDHQRATEFARKHLAASPTPAHTEIGSIRHVRVHWTFKGADGTIWRAFPETGRWWSLAANGTHCLDLIRWMFRPESGEIVSIHAVTGGSVWDSLHDETAILSACFESVATAEFCTSVLFDSASRIEIYGSDGTVICDDTLGRHGSGTILFNGSVLEYEVVNPYAGEMRDFVEAIHDGRPRKWTVKKE